MNKKEFSVFIPHTWGKGVRYIVQLENGKKKELKRYKSNIYYYCVDRKKYYVVINGSLYSPKFKELQDRDFELYNEDEIEGYLDEFYKGKLHICDDFELCCLYDNVDRPKYSVYLAFYDDKLYWTLNKHNGKRYDDYENKYTFEWIGEKLNKENLYATAKMVLTKLVDNYEKVQRSIKCL